MFKKIQAATAANAALLALPMTFCMVAAAQAQSSSRSTDMQRVEVSGRHAQEPRTDVSASCPGIAGSLQRSLSRVVYLEGRSGIVDVDFTLRGDDVEAVKSKGGPSEYHGAIRRAVRGLNCSHAGATEQPYRFQIAFVHEDDLPAGNRSTVAVLLPARR